MRIASSLETLRVRLLSLAQHKHTPMISSAPTDSRVLSGCQDSKSPPATIAIIPSTICRSVFPKRDKCGEARPAFQPT